MEKKTGGMKALEEIVKTIRYDVSERNYGVARGHFELLRLIASPSRRERKQAKEFLAKIKEELASLGLGDS